LPFGSVIRKEKRDTTASPSATRSPRSKRRVRDDRRARDERLEGLAGRRPPVSSSIACSGTGRIRIRRTRCPARTSCGTGPAPTIAGRRMRTARASLNRFHPVPDGNGDRGVALAARIAPMMGPLGAPAEAAPYAARGRADVREVANHVRAVEEALRPDRDLPVSLRLIRTLHRVLLSGTRSEHLTPGEFRRSQNWIGPVGCSLDDATFVPPPPDAMAAYRTAAGPSTTPARIERGSECHRSNASDRDRPRTVVAPISGSAISRRCIRS
jgi:hypothetical protein